MYNTIINPLNNKSFSIFSNQGKTLLKSYIKEFNGSGWFETVKSFFRFGKKHKEDYKIVEVTRDNFKKYKLEKDLSNISFDVNLIIKEKNRKGVFLIKDNKIVGFYSLLLDPILLLVIITISREHRGKRLCYKLMDYLIDYIKKKDIKVLKIVNAGGISALKCYSYIDKLNYNIFYKNNDEWIKINKDEMLRIGKEMIDRDEWMELLFINKDSDITEYSYMIDS